MERSRINFIVMDFILLFVAVGFIFAVFDLSGPTFVFQLVVMLLFLLLMVISMAGIYHGSSRGWAALGAILILTIVDIFFIFLILNSFRTSHLITIFFSILGLIVVLLSFQKEREEIYEDEGYYDRQEKESSYYPKTEKDKEKPKKEEPKVKPEPMQTKSQMNAGSNFMPSQGNVVAITGIRKEKGYLYFLDKNGDVARVKMARRGQKSDKRQEIIAKAGVKRKEGYLYYIDNDGNVAAAKMAKPRKK